MRILCAADIHIGRTSTKLPKEFESSQFTCSSAWQRIVECACSKNVDCVVLPGDVVDRANSRFEAMGAMERGIQQLAMRRIPIYAITGNHDSDVLPKIADGLGESAFYVLGRDGGWEYVPGPGGVRIVGKCFNEAESGDEVLDGFPAPDSNFVHTVAILHSSLSGGTDPYMPVSRDDLSSVPNTVWMVGHVHQGSPGSHVNNIIVPGSPQALDPRETGLHGVSIVDIDAGGVKNIHSVPISTARYESLEVSLEGVEDDVEVPGRIQDALDDVLKKDGQTTSDYDLISLRVTLTGHSKLHDSLRKSANDLQGSENTGLDANISLEKVEAATVPCIDLGMLSHSDDLLGRLATLIKSIEDGEDNSDFDEIIGLCEESADHIYSQNVYAGVSRKKTTEPEDVVPDRGQLTQMLQNKAKALLSELLAQRGEE